MSSDIDVDDDVDWSTWVDADLSEDLDILEDPDYVLFEEVGENSIATSSNTKRYNLRNRHK